MMIRAGFRNAAPQEHARLSSARKRLALLTSAMLLAGLAGGCSSKLGQFKGSLGDVTPSITSPSQADLSSLARRYDARPGEKAASLAYGQALRASGQHAQAVAVLERAAIGNAGDREIAAAYGRALGDIGRFEQAMSVLAQAHAPDRPDWRVLSSQGVVADHMGQHARAREFYQQALQIRPDDPGVLSNLGLSYLLSRDLAKAEETLSRAASRANADPRVAANLALVRDLRSKVAAAPVRAPEKARPKAQAPAKPLKLQ